LQRATASRHQLVHAAPPANPVFRMEFAGLPWHFGHEKGLTVPDTWFGSS
jgi:hypothetical protein